MGGTTESAYSGGSTPQPINSPGASVSAPPQRNPIVTSTPDNGYVAPTPLPANPSIFAPRTQPAPTTSIWQKFQDGTPLSAQERAYYDQWKQQNPEQNSKFAYQLGQFKDPGSAYNTPGLAANTSTTRQRDPTNQAPGWGRLENQRVGARATPQIPTRHRSPTQMPTQMPTRTRSPTMSLGQRLGLGGAGNLNPQSLGGNVNWEDIMARFRQPSTSQGNPWQGGLQALRDRFTRGNPSEAITNPGSLAASQGAPTSSGITAPGAATGAPASPTNANPHAPTSGQGMGAQGRGNTSHAQQLIQALRSRAGGR